MGTRQHKRRRRRPCTTATTTRLFSTVVMVTCLISLTSSSSLASEHDGASSSSSTAQSHNNNHIASHSTRRRLRATSQSSSHESNSHRKHHNSNRRRHLELESSYQQSLYPYIPKHNLKTCTNNAQPQSWELSTSSPTLSECCTKHFAWDTHTCLYEGELLYNTTQADLQARDELGPTPSPTREVHPFIPNFELNSCYNNQPTPLSSSGNIQIIQSFTTLKQCCKSNFRHILQSCLSTGELAINELKDVYAAQDAGLNPYLPNWSLQVCDRSKVPEVWDEVFDTLGECCNIHFGMWNLDNCLASDKGGGDDDDGGEPPTTTPANDNDNNNEPEPKPTYWFPIWSQSHCVTNQDETPPAYMTNDPINEMWTTYIECCEINFQNAEWTDEQNTDSLASCMELSAPYARYPTPPPVEQYAGDMTLYYYPNYIQNKCQYNAGMYADEYMKMDPFTYFSVTVGECCRAHFAEVGRKDCVSNSDKPPPSTGINGGDEVVNPTHYKYEYYPHLKKVACIQNTNMDAPSYMYDSPATFFFDDYKTCCSLNFNIEYKDCLQRSELVELGHELHNINGLNDDAMMRNNGPAILIQFSCKLYFRNVFIPTSIEHLKIIRNVILGSVKVTLGAEYRVPAMDGITFDGTNIAGLDEQIQRRRGVRDLSEMGQLLEEVSEEKSQLSRALNRLQLFQFTMSVSYDCDEACLSDITAAGRSASFDITNLFDDGIYDGSIFARIKNDMESMGYIGPFSGASLDEGILYYEDVVMDAVYTWAPTISPPPTPRPNAQLPTSSEASSLHKYYPDLEKRTCLNDGKHGEYQPNLYDTLSSCCEFPWLDYVECLVLAEPTVPIVPQTNKYYPDLEEETCLNDGNEGEYQPNLYNTLDECCDFPWLNRVTCMAKAEASNTQAPTSKPITPRPTRSPSKKPSNKPLEEQNQWPYGTYTTEWPTFSPSSEAPITPPPTPRPTPKPTGKPINCDGDLGWHIDSQMNDGCSNNNIYPEVWASDNLKAEMFHPSWDACCQAFFPPGECAKYDICADIDTNSGGGSIEPIQRDTPTPTPGTKICPYGWHVHKTSNLGCSNSDDIVESWLQPDLVEYMFYVKHEDCCKKFFPISNGACPKYDVGCQVEGDDKPVEDTPSPTNKPSTSDPGHIGNDVTVSSESLWEHMEVVDLSMTKFTTTASKPWQLTNDYAVSGSNSVNNSLTTRGESSKLTLSLNCLTPGVLLYELRHDVFAPWAALQVLRDDETIAAFFGHSDDPVWNTENIFLTNGIHSIVWDVSTQDSEIPPGQRGTGTVWIDDVRFVEAILLDWEDNVVDQDIVSFEGFGKWRIDDAMPGKTSPNSLHSPKGLLPGEQSSMIITQTSQSSSGLISFDVHVGLGKFSFYIDGVKKYEEDGPAEDTSTYQEKIDKGTHKYEFKYEPPSHANMPMSMVWIDNIMITK